MGYSAVIMKHAYLHGIHAMVSVTVTLVMMRQTAIAIISTSIVTMANVLIPMPVMCTVMER